MITVVYRVVAKEGQSQNLENIISDFEQCAHESPDCIYYTFFKSISNSLEYLVYYRFATKLAQDEHIKNLQTKVGPPRIGRDLPEKFLDLLDQEELVLFEDK